MLLQHRHHAAHHHLALRLRSALPPSPPGSGAPAPDPSRNTSCIRTTWWRRWCAVRRAPAPASADWPHRSVRPAPPAPIMVCASSMKRMIGVGEDLHLFDQALQPVLEFALDAGAGLQQRQIERAQRDVLQHRRHVAVRRCAARSLPPPPSCRRPPRRRGSGLFCRRRVRMSMTCRISKSRPSTGSILPFLAFSVRLTVN